MGSYGNAGCILSAGDIAKMRPNGKFIQMDDVIFYILACHGSGKGNRIWITMDVRELLNEEISTILIGWNSTDTIPNYTTTYITQTKRPGAKQHELSKLYNLKINNPVFKLLNIDLRMCLYKGNYICKDLKNGEEYSFAHSTQQIKKELSEIKSGDIVSVCRYQGFDFFIASYQCTYPAIKKFEKTQDIILKQGTSYKWATAQIGKSYRVSSLIGYNQRAERYPLLDRSFSMDICEEAIAVYGYANAFLYEGERVVVFTNIANGKMYSVPMDTVKEADFKALCEDTYFFKAHLTTDGSCLAYLAKGYPTEKLETLEYLYEDDGKACCMDAYTYELYEIPLRDLPKGTKENEMLSGYTAQHDELKAVNTEGRIFVLHKL